jgi:sarcosine oxidase
VPRDFDVIVVGLGAMGSAAAYHLARSGLNVLGLDRFHPPHTFGSSHGQTRIIREAYFEHASYVPIVRRAYELWAELAAQTQQQLFLQTGGVMIGPPKGVVVRGAQHSAELHDLEYEYLSAQDIRARFPALRPTASMAGIWEPRAGVLFPERCVEAHLAMARRSGAALAFDEEVTSWEPAAERVRVRTAKAEYRAAQLVLSAGSWIQKLAPDLDLPARVERQTLFWFEPLDTSVWRPDRCPIHLWEYSDGRFFYGFPDLGHGVKLARHHEGVTVDPDAVSREATLHEANGLRRVTRPFLAGLGPCVNKAVCLYTDMPDGHFLIDTHPAYPQVLIVSPCSGHGFKFSAAIGEMVRDLVKFGKSRFDLSLFSIGKWVNSP